MKLALSTLVALLLVAPADRHGWVLDDFEDGDLIAAHGLGWIGLGDDLLGGGSRITLSVAPQGAHGSRHALALRGQLGEGPNAFTGAWAPLDGRARPVDLGAFEGLRLWVRGEGAFQVGMRQGPMTAATNFMAPFTATAEWKRLDVPFASLAPSGRAPKDAAWSPKDVHWLGVTTATGAQGPFRLEVDDVELVPRADAGQPAPVATAGPPRTVRIRLSPAPRSGAWRDLAHDPAGDGKQKSLPDATSLSVLTDDKEGLVWFRIGLAAALPEPWIGVNLALDTDGNPENGMAWWGTNTAFKFDRLVTVWVFRTGEEYQGIVGIAGSASVADGEMIDEALARPRLALDRPGHAVLVGVPPTALGSATGKVRLVAAVGSAFAHNDDIPDTGAAELAR